eukprot:365749-Chlamydomonas_euryale.AAC.9
MTVKKSWREHAVTPTPPPPPPASFSRGRGEPTGMAESPQRRQQHLVRPGSASRPLRRVPGVGSAPTCEPWSLSPVHTRAIRHTWQWASSHDGPSAARPLANRIRCYAHFRNGKLVAAPGRARRVSTRWRQARHVPGVFGRAP